jgi:hypothetical protein
LIVVRRLLITAIGLMLGLCPTPASAGAAWGSTGYGDPPGWCTRFSDMWTATVVTSDTLVGTNPERSTFYGFHPDPGYDDWYGYFYGDFRGSPGDASGWVKLLHERYPDHYDWNFATNGWAVHGHAKEYIAYYNWTFGGQCGMGWYGRPSPAPFMADQYGWPVVDIYVDSVPPYPPSPRVVATSPTSVTFTWDAVADRGDGAGRDFFEVGMDHYDSWVTVDGGAQQQLESTSAPRTITEPLSPGQTACVHVRAFDRLQNGTADEVACARALGAPPMPSWGALGSRVAANPSRQGLVGFESWLWLDPAPPVLSGQETYMGVHYVITAVPDGADWDFGDATGARFRDDSGFGLRYPARSAVAHTYQAHSVAGYLIQAAVRYQVSWSANVGGSWVGPYAMGTISLAADPLVYPVEQAQPELMLLGTSMDSGFAEGVLPGSRPT